MKKTALLSAALLMAAASLFAHGEPGGTPLDAATEKLVRANLTQCDGMTLTGDAFAQKMPLGLSAKLIRSASPNHLCDGQYLLVTSNGGTYWLGSPWFLGDAGGTTIEEKLQAFAWRAMQSNVTATIDRKRSPEGLFRATVMQTTEAGKIPLEGLVDADGRVFFLGPFLPLSSDSAKARASAFAPLAATAPAKGAAAAPVTIVEFSDFQCPSCKRSAGVGEAVVARFGDRVRYVRYDLPLITSHPWAFGAAMAGRAIYAQKPELFWSYKKQVYENQDKLNAFVFADFARGFAEDNGLDMQRYDADVVAEAMRDEILKGVGAAFANGVRATPTFMVNGVFVGSDVVEAYVENLLK
jgi:protein-disulfide isomerase